MLVEVSVSLRNILEIDEHKQVSPSLSTFNKGVFYRSPQTLVSLSQDINSPRASEGSSVQRTAQVDAPGFVNAAGKLWQK